MVHGARIGGRWCASKKALRQALAADPASVWFEAADREIRGDGLGVGARLIVAGPNPAQERWRAVVTVRADGRFSVK